VNCRNFDPSRLHNCAKLNGDKGNIQPELGEVKTKEEEAGKIKLQENMDKPQGDLQQSCVCPKILRPVCLNDGEKVADNQCIAEKCLKIHPDKLFECSTLDEAKVKMADDDFIVCTAEYNPQCTTNGTVVGSNPCMARS
jgi:hypothetical protein